jgi:hypothetical protein
MAHKQPLRKGMLTVEDVAKTACFLLVGIRQSRVRSTGRGMTGWRMKKALRTCGGRSYPLELAGVRLDAPVNLARLALRSANDAAAASTIGLPPVWM